MTISLIVFVTLQFYWLKNYYGALEQEFSNKVYSALEGTAKTIGEIEVDKYLNEDNKDFRNNILANSDQPTLTTIQQVEDSGTRRQIIYSKNIIEKSQLPISLQGDSIKLTKLYSDEAAYKIKRDTTSREILTADINQGLENGDFYMREYAKIVGNNIPITKRVNPKVLDSVIAKELRVRGISAKFGYGITDKNNKVTSVVTKDYKEEKDSNRYSYPLFTDKKERTLYNLALVFPKKEYSLAMNNW